MVEVGGSSPSSPTIDNFLRNPPQINGGFCFGESTVHLIINVNLKIVYLYHILIKIFSDEKHLYLLNNVVSKFPSLIK